MASRLTWLAVLAALAGTAARAQTTLSTGSFEAAFAADSGVLQSLVSTADGFDFSPSDVFPRRNGDGNYHTGDVTLRYRAEGASDWISDDSAAARRPVVPLPDGGGGNSSSSGGSSSSSVAWDLSPTLPNSNSSLRITRSWSGLAAADGRQAGDAVLNFTLTNVAETALELGSLGFPLEFDSIFSAYGADRVQDRCVLVDPYVGLGAGYVQVTRLSGTGPNLLITPLDGADGVDDGSGDSTHGGAQNKLEAWRQLFENDAGGLGYMSNPFEGFFEWQVYSKAWAETEWKGVQQWNTPTSLLLKPGQSRSFAFRLSLAGQVHEVEDKLAQVGIPYVVGIPGYVVPRDADARLFVNSAKAVKSIDVSPSDALVIEPVSTSPSLSAPWSAYSVRPGSSSFGRVTVTITYDGGRQQTVHYFVTAPGPDTVAAFGNFLTTKQYYTDTSDPFGRAPSVLSYDNEVQNFVLQDPRVWIAGLSDDGGAGSFLAASMKNAFAPVPGEVEALEAFVNETLWARLQMPSGDEAYAVRKSLFYHDTTAQPTYPYDSSIDWSGWESWNKEQGYDAIDRAYNYVHVSAAHWALYRVARNFPDLVKANDWQWYLDHAWNTVKFALGSGKTSFADLGLMGETVWGYILADMKSEGDEWSAQAAELEQLLKARQAAWAKKTNPFGSEQAWDSTGQEGVYYWSNYFNDSVSADKTLASIRGFDPAVAHWAYNGNARRYWDFGTAGKLSRIERQGHHYGSPLNALPLVENFRRQSLSSSSPSPSPSASTSAQSFHDLRVGVAGNMASLSNIDARGFGSMAFHTWPDRLAWDAYSGDYGLGFSGHVMGTATYLLRHPTFGRLAFAGNIVDQSQAVTVQPKDSLRQRIFVAGDNGESLFVHIQSGAIDRFVYDPSTGRMQVAVVASAHESMAKADKVLLKYDSNVLKIVDGGYAQERGGYLVSFDGDTEKVVVFERS